MMGITGAFSSLGINERARSKEKKFPKNCSTISLPNMVLSERPSKFIRPVCDDDQDGEQPVDFSKKYSESQKERNCSFNSVAKGFNTNFTMYAETDLDQPTDYSLRYAEDDSDSDRGNKIPKTEATEFVQDTVKTYCTEDTPYETPFNFSTSTSMSDLRIDDKGEKGRKSGNATEINTKEAEAPPRKIKSEFSSGLMSPEKPVNYCEEGTPGYFSRVPSCGSLNSIPKQEQKEEQIVKKEVKAVKFEEVVNYAEETPLMFSRSSSLGSLDSIDQHSIHDDRSSIVSDFSRLTSGVISPSELPDSPSQTVPPSPRPRKTPMVFPLKEEEPPKPPPKCSVFEDVVKKFKVESTPLQFSAATSLSSLDEEEKDVKESREEIAPPDGEDLNTLDLSESSEDEDILAACINIGMQSNRYSQVKSKSPSAATPYKADVTSDSLRTYCTEGTPALLSHAGSNSDLSEKINDSLEAEKRDLLDREEDSEDDALLEACILSGMPKAKDTNRKEVTEEEADILEKCIVGIESNYPKPEFLKLPSTDDAIRRYFTEDTPAGLSHAGSISNLSVLSTQGENTTDNYFSDVNSNFSDDDDDKLLEECVKFGMAAISSKAQTKEKFNKRSKKREVPRGKTSDDGLSSFSDDSYETDNILLQQCIKAGMPKRAESSDLSTAEKALLQQCILEGMKKCRIVPAKPSEDLTQAEQALLRQCILAGMPKNKNLSQGGPSRARETTDLTESERLLLQQCILAGMPKNRSKLTGSRQMVRKPKEEKSGEHTCCVHCPKNKTRHVKGKKKYKDRGAAQYRDNRDVNIVYVTNQILVKTEVVDRTHENWV